ncbi:hypothetical protein NIES806_41160 [Dolichospermum compactum NIES-806]|uniref:Uncharacterized protein n=1 Tax=Dolichospermum compactum NIES-806 TaxID=1973481 RepID=A0A1Z4V8X1_9CYAN|nr:hypothetical protein NIES806_41160 [Dolichospermum compactum NIES-806]
MKPPGKPLPNEHADIGAAKTIRDRGFKIVRGDSAKLAV